MAADVMQVPVSAPGAPTFIRLLARASGAPAQAPALPLARQLGEWIDWTRAVSLSRALDGEVQPAEPGATPDHDTLLEDCARIRAELEESIHTGPAPARASAGFAPWQQHILAMQRAMQTATGYLRGDLRELLAAGSPSQARLAEVDAAMEAALSPREHALLQPVAAALAARFEHLEKSAAASATPDAAAPAPDSETAPSTWATTFRHELRDLLLAELDLRFQPVEGLLAALRSP
ncbi:DUF3348 family protein [Luteimonas sp. A478]